MDDILITGKVEKDHLQNLDVTLQRLKDYGLRVHKDKCAFFHSLVEYLRHILDTTGPSQGSIQGQGYLRRSQLFRTSANYVLSWVTELLRTLYPELSNEAEATA